MLLKTSSRAAALLAAAFLASSAFAAEPAGYKAPAAPHGYRAMVSTAATLWQMTHWLDRWMKPKRPPAPTAASAP